MPRQQPSSPKKKRKQLDFEDWYEIAKKYYEEHGDLLVPRIYEDEEGHKIIVLGVANVWENRKGLFDFYKLAQMLDDRYIIVLVGLSEKQIKDLSKNIKGIQRTNSPQELAAIYTAADVFVNPTYEDNYPTVNLEAQACGTPVITYDTGGCRETIHTDSAKVVEAGNVEGLYKEITIR